MAERMEASFVQELNGKAPKNGEILARTYTKGSNSFAITVGDMDTLVKLESVSDPSKYTLVYIRANQKVTVYNILNDEYRIKYATGPVWYGTEDLFGPDATYIQLTETINPESSRSGTYRTWTEYTWEVDYGYGTEYGVQNMDPNNF